MPNDVEELERTIAALREAVRARDEFLAIAAHELRNPMHALALQVTVMLSVAHRKGDRELVERLEKVQLTVDRYVRRATVLLDVSRITTGGLHLDRERFDMVPVVCAVLDAASAEATFHQVELRPSLPPTLSGRWDRLAVEQVAGNLLSNALKYGAGAPVDVTLARDGDDAVLTVRDRGIGISEEDQRRIFERFEQVVGPHSRGGFGIGLWLARSLVEAHGGSIAIESTPGRGSAFTVRLPIERETDAS